MKAVVALPLNRLCLNLCGGTVALSPATSAIIGFCLTLEQPSRLSVALCLAQAMCRKEDWLAARDINHSWSMFAVYDAVHDTEEMGSRFDTIPIPRWAYDEDFATLVDSLETSMPLARASDLSRPSLAEIIHELSEGLIGEVVDMVSNAAIKATRNGEEHISEATIASLGYTSLSKRRNAPLRREMM